ncbi:MAG: response regulator, partial [Gammaproteobacteria bacterium]|nr:response regulator [Gammaproteobacteria bacterium]
MSAGILFVDDEQPVLDACRRALRKKTKIDTALGPNKALELIDSNGGYAVIVSDMRMPEMTGVQLLAEVKRRSPQTVRMMLTGNSDQQTAIDAVNEGDIFRFLNKPCPPDKLWSSVEAALEQHRLIRAEQELLENTLQGAIQVLADVLALVNPEAFGRTTRIKTHVRAVAEALELPDLWRYETMAMLSQVGCVTVPDAVLQKAMQDEALVGEEKTVFARHPAVAADLLTTIPRMEEVAEAIRHQHTDFDSNSDIPMGARILRVALDFERFELATSSDDALDRLRARAPKYDADVISAFERVIGDESGLEARELDISQLTDGMVLAADVMMLQKDTLIVCK